MANNDILVESSLLSSQKNISVQQKKVADKSVVVKTTGNAQPQSSTEVGQPSQDGQKKAQQSNLNDKVAKLNDYMQSLNRSLRFSIDHDTGDVVVKVIDSKTNQLIRQIPSQEMLDIQHAAEKYRGIIFEKKA